MAFVFSPAHFSGLPLPVVGSFALGQANMPGNWHISIFNYSKLVYTRLFSNARWVYKAALGLCLKYSVGYQGSLKILYTSQLWLVFY